MKHLRKTSAILLVLAMFAVTTAQAGEQVVSPFDGLDPLTLLLSTVTHIGSAKEQHAQEFARLVNEYSEGKITVEIYAGGILGGHAETTAGLATGLTHIDVAGPGFVSQFLGRPEIFFEAMNYLYNDVEHYQRIWAEGGVGWDLMADLLADTPFISVSAGLDGVRYFTSNVPIHTIDDVRGMLFRVAPLAIEAAKFAVLGLRPTPLPFTDTYTALQQGLVTGQENPLLTIESGALYEVQQYLVATAHNLVTDHLFMDRNFFNSLPEAYREVILRAGAETSGWRTQLAINLEAELLEKMQNEYRMTLIVPTDLDVWDQLSSEFALTYEGGVFVEIYELFKSN